MFIGLHFSLRSFLPIFVFLIIVFLELPALAYILVLLSKWRILAGKPRFWWSNLRINAADLIFSLSVIQFMSWPSLELSHQLIWLFLYLVWVLVLRSMAPPNKNILQGIIAQGIGVSTLLYNTGQIYLPLLLFGVWIISISAVRHMFHGLPKMDYFKSLIHIWGLFSIQLAWVLLHWQINFWFIPHLVFLQVVILTALSILYILHQKKTLSLFLKRQIIVSLLIIVALVLFFSGIRTVTL